MSTSAEAPRLPVAVLLSGRGSNLAALIRARDQGRLPIDLVLVLSDRPQAAGLAIAAAAGIACWAEEPKVCGGKAAFEAELDRRLRASGCGLVVLAGFMRVLSADFVAAWRGKLINIHPSLLPRYPGLHTHQRALDAGDSRHGASVHYVSEVLDGGPVLMQSSIEVSADDDAPSLAARLLPVEHRLLVAAVSLIAESRARLQGDTIEVDGQVLERPLVLG